MQVNLYQVEAEHMLRSCCALLSKTYSGDHKTLVVTRNEEDAALLDKVLWTFSQSAFVPHATILDERRDSHPILITWKKIDTCGFDSMCLVGMDFSQFEDMDFELGALKLLFAFHHDKDAVLKYGKYCTDISLANYYLRDAKAGWVKQDIKL